MTVREAFAKAGHPVPDNFDLVWNSRSGWVIRGDVEATFLPHYAGKKAPDKRREVAFGWFVPFHSTYRELDEPMSSVAAAVNVLDALPECVRKVVEEA